MKKRKNNKNGKVEEETVEEALIPQQNQEEQPLVFKEYSWIEIVQHDKPGDCWVVIHGKVYDLSQFAKVHPGYSFSILTFPKLFEKWSNDL